MPLLKHVYPHHIYIKYFLENIPSKQTFQHEISDKKDKKLPVKCNTHTVTWNGQNQSLLKHFLWPFGEVILYFLSDKYIFVDITIKFSLN